MHASRTHATLSLLLLALGLAAAPTATAQSAYTIEDVMSYSFPTEVVAAPEGETIAWFANDEGLRNVWVAHGPEWTPLRLTHYEEDDGQELSGLQFSPDGRTVIYLRGGTTNRDGELPNPTSEPDGVSRDLWMVSLDGGDPVLLAGAVSPLMSPTENQVVWASSGQAWIRTLDAAGEPQPLFQVRSGLSDLAWSPEGGRIAFVSARDGRAILGVYHLATDEIEWVTNTVDRDDMPRWSRDGTRIAFVRYISGHAGYSIWRHDFEEDETIELFRSADDRSGRFPRSVSGSYELMYGDGYLVFPGEWSGWNHLYRISDDGGDVEELTPGDGIVENAALSRDGRWVWVSANTQSIDYRQLGRVRLRDARQEWFESGNAIGWNPAPGDGDDWIAYIRSDAWEPATVAVRDLGDAAPLRVGQHGEAFPVEQMTTPEQVVYESPDGLSIHAQLFLPRAYDGAEPLPAVIFMHGGSRRQMFLGWHNRGYYHGAYAFNQFLASQGYAVLSVNYRSGIGYGVEFREPADYGISGASEYQDVVAAGLYLQTRPEVDPERIGLWGGSYGGYLTALGLARDSELFRAGVDVHGVHDWVEQRRWYGRNTNFQMGEEARRIAFESSPVADIDTWQSPVLIVHGDDDRNVPFEASIDLVRRLREKGDVHFEELYFVDEVHGFLRHENWLAVFRAAHDFFERHLKNAPRVQADRGMR